jgi:hypothetical protein
VTFIVERDDALTVGDTVVSPNGDHVFRAQLIEAAGDDDRDVDAVVFVESAGSVG